MTTEPFRCQVCGNTKFSYSYGKSLQCADCEKRYTPEDLARANAANPLIELCRYCNCSTPAVRGWWGRFVACLRCGSRGPRVGTTDQAIWAWNAQHAPLALRAVTEVREPLATAHTPT